MESDGNEWLLTLSTLLNPYPAFGKWQAQSKTFIRPGWDKQGLMTLSPTLCQEAKDISHPLHALMNNEQMVEAHDGLVVLGGVEAGTFVGFCELTIAWG